jgi:pimeloyl-ACP methyl ester carboxylesterase
VHPPVELGTPGVSLEGRTNNTFDEGTPGRGVENAGVWELGKQIYKELVGAIIRPPRAAYLVEELGPTSFLIDGKEFVRTDVELMNSKGFVLQCSYWEPKAQAEEPPPCVIYLHGNSSCRLEATEVLDACLGFGLTVFAFDFAGSGHSEGDFVSLGYFEQEDLQVVADFLLDTGVASTLGVWGRSMGAATALLHGGTSSNITAYVFDSPFADLEQLALELVQHSKDEGAINVPMFMARIALSMIGSSVQKEAGFSIHEVKPIKAAVSCSQPAMFAVAQEDELIPNHHSQELYDAYLGKKIMVKMSGGHATPRPSSFYHSAALFLATLLHLTPEHTNAEVLGQGFKFCSPQPPWRRGAFWASFDGMKFSPTTVERSGDKVQEAEVIAEMIGDAPEVMRAYFESNSRDGTKKNNPNDGEEGKEASLWLNLPIQNREFLR